MGTARWSSDDWKGFSARTSTKRTEEIFTSSGLNPDLDPKGVNRESRDSTENPESNAIIIGCDVSGSMGILAENLIRKGMGVLFEEIYDRKPVSDPHIAVMGIGDAIVGDRAPLQVSQFEADLTITDWLTKIYIEQGGGGNCFESYDLPAYFAAYHTSIDCFEKRGKKGYLFTMGDELPPPCTTAESVNRIIGDDHLQADIPYSEVLAAAEKLYHVFHLVVEEGAHCRWHGIDKVLPHWTTLLGQRAIVLSDHTKLSEVIVSCIQVTEGASKDVVAKSWDGDTALVVATAISDLTPTESFDEASGVVDL